MILPSHPAHSSSLMAVEGALALIAIALAFTAPNFGRSCFAWMELRCGALAKQQRLAVLVVGFSAFVLRLALLPLSPIPSPFIHDDFSLLLASDTFASGRLTNPTPAMWQHFESFHITLKPTYMSMYYPAQGLLLAAGQKLTGHPWFGVLVATSLMCAAICWMLQAWLPLSWAFLGGMLSVLRLGLFSYWINTYTGAGSVAALGGALILGSLPRIQRKPKARYGFAIATGIVLLGMSRPYEGLLLCLAAAVFLARWWLGNRHGLEARRVVPLLVYPSILLVAAATWMMYYNYRVFGNPLTQPYTINRQTYAVAPHFIWQKLHEAPTYRHPVMRAFYLGWELDGYRKIRTLSGFASETLVKTMRAAIFFVGFAMLPPFLMARRVLIDRRTRFLLISTLVLTAGMLVETWLIPHYLAPFTCVFYALGLQAARHLRVWKPGHRFVGLATVRWSVALCVLLAIARAFAGPLHLTLSSQPETAWFGSPDFGIPRAQVASALEKLPRNQLAIVRYPATHSPFNDWVYNAADIDRSKVIWAREMDPAQDRELLDYYKDRHVWLVQPDLQPASVTPYTPAALP